MGWREAFNKCNARQKVLVAILCAWETNLSWPWREWARRWVLGENVHLDMTTLARHSALITSECRAAWRVTDAVLKGSGNREFYTRVARSVMESESHGVHIDPIVDAVLMGEERQFLERLTLGR